ncbi:MAG: MinD/ParA family protein [Deltaproteobacteria bacterium]|nr:MAG: MinD/ParA family protein [Deltaproteobacteria bacterium]
MEWGSEVSSVSLAIGGGKGGTGKSFLALNLGVALAELGKKVVLLDVDLAGGANLHTLLGIPLPQRTIEHFLRREAQIEEVMLDTPVVGLRLISGALVNLSDKLRYEEKKRLLKALKALRADYLILDLGAGISPFTLDLFLSAQRKVVVVTPEGTAIENAYRFLRGAYLRGLRRMADEGIRRIIDLAFTGRDPSVRTPWELLSRIEGLDGETASRFRESLKGFGLCVIVNQLKRGEERQLGLSFKTVCRKYFGIDPLYLGYIPFDPKVSFAINRGRPFLLEYPHTEVAQCIRGIASRVISGREMAVL